MIEIVNRLERLVESGLKYFSNTSESELTNKENSKKWSKKEILGHLIDSGINNLQRFTEIQFIEKPYRLKNYNQNELVIANGYQTAETKEIIDFWISLNNRIKNIMNQQTETTLIYKIEIDKKNKKDLKFLMKDYVDHLEHHLNQIMK